MTTSITATPQPNATPPRIRLDITTDQASLVLYRVGQDGSRTPVRTYDGGPLPVAGTSVVLHDVEAPLGEPVTYTADGLDVTGSAQVTVDADSVWLVDPAIPSRSRPIRIARMSDRAAAAAQSVRYPLGRKFPIVANDGVRKADTYTLTLRTSGAAEVTALQELFADLSPLLLNIPASKQWIDMQTEYIAVGDLARANPTGWAGFAHREWPLPCSVADRPAGGTQAFNTYAYSKSLYPTYADRKAAHATYGEAFNIE